MKKVLNEAIAYLTYCGVRFPKREAEDILMDMVGQTSRAQLIHLVLSDEQLKAFWQRVITRGRGVPTAYVHGEVSFLDLRLIVNRDVLIPRLETELLAERIQQDLYARPHIQRFYDVCCGSGCLGLSIKKRFPHLEVILSDLCPKAVRVAKENAVKNGLSVEILEGDLFSPYTSLADAFVCNPPYLSFQEILSVDMEVRCHEPWKALVAGPSGLEFYERIAAGLSSILAPDGIGWLEIGAGQGEDVKRIFARQGISGRLYQDFAGWDRIFFLENHATDAVSSCDCS